MTNQDTHTNVQAVRRVYEHEHPTNSTSSSTEIIYIAYQPDSSSGRDIILWDDILDVFSNALYVRSGAVALPFLKGPDFKKLDPLRIAAVLGVTLDVVVRSELSEKELSLESLQTALPGTTREGSTASTDSYSNIIATNAAAIVRRNPAGGLVEEAMDAYRNNDNSAFGPRPRGPQAILDTTPFTGGTTPTSQELVSNSQTSALQESTSTTNNDTNDETLKKAESGDKDAQFTLGHKTYYAQGVPQDYHAAKEWYFKAAKQGHSEAQMSIGYMSQYGQGTPQDYAAAMDWYLKAADQGEAAAQNNIGFMYCNGQGVPRDYSLAMEWYLKSANQGYALTQNNIGDLYHKGYGVPQDYTSAMDWYLKAARQRDAEAQNNIGLLYQDGLGVARDYSQAMSWFRKAADQGHAPAQSNVAWLYEQGMGVSKDRVKAIEWYRKAVAGGDANAKMHLDGLEQQGSDSVAGDTKRGLFKRLFNSTSPSNDPTIMTAHDNHPNIQAVRRVYENEQPVSNSAPTGITHLVCQPDASSGKNILLWDDVLDAFKEDVIHIRSGTVVLPFLKGPGFKKLDPLRIAAVPGATLDVVIRGRPEEKELSLGSLQEAMPGAHQQCNHNKSNGNIDTGAKELKASSNSISLALPPQESTSTTAQDITEIMMKAWLGDMHAQNALGDMYKDDRGVHRDYQTAMNWYLKAAQRGLASAQFNIGDMYDNGRGVPKDFTKAMAWFRKAAAQDYAPAQYSIGQLYQNGQGVVQDFHEAMKWFIKAVDQELTLALRNIGRLHENGQGVPQDYSAAMEWYLKAADRGDATAQNNIGSLYQNGLSVPQDYPAAMNWYLKAANQGHAGAQNNIGLFYHDGHGVPKDYSSAMDWYLKSANQGDAAAQNNIRSLFQNGLGFPQDYSAAMEWRLKPADQGHATAQNNIGSLYQNGLGVPRDYPAAMNWYLKAANQGHAPAQSNIGSLYHNGLGVAQDYSQAMSWFRKAADQGYAKAQNNIACMNEQGLGVSEDRAKAVEWHRKAFAGGEAGAKVALDRLEHQGSDFDARFGGWNIKHPPLLTPGPGFFDSAGGSGQSKSQKENTLVAKWFRHGTLRAKIRLCTLVLRKGNQPSNRPRQGDRFLNPSTS
ncbi:MAG: hypothetical protein J3R72DRAFT_528789 [Linnemannia gamsii]|nr:MAG: hypothetical protein J3R72DRAFT_528789 [Linnemannia gamsii]